ncbi:solute carrier family 23 member 3 isoform X6 [Monodelphis domestica]|uniref:solute carrier family 23 member 3 isoform X6 n=1 Tax=Monodelphis domestica TaxID=13616 RepID=UPI00044310CD|nr:solute carrier family 23 member 3 isoform X6 [Monodelphis domestica]
MNKQTHQPDPLPCLDSQASVALRPAPQSPSPQSLDFLCAAPSWGLSWLLAVQHILVLASLLCVSHLLLLRSLSPGGLSYAPAQLLASSLFSCGLSTAMQTWMGSRLPLVQAPSFEFLIPALVLTSQKPSHTTWAPGNNSQTPGPCVGTACFTLGSWDESLREVLLPVVCVWILSALLGLSFTPQELSAPNIPPWLWLPHPGGWGWPKLTLRGLAAGTTMALASSTSSLCCYALCGRLLQLTPPPSYACSRGMGFEGLGSLLAGLLGSPLGTASSFPNVATTSLTQAGSQRVARLASLLCIGLGLSPRLTQALTTIPLPVHGAVLGVNQAVILSMGFSYFYSTDIDSGRNVFIVGFAIFMALLLPRWLQDAPILNTGLSPVDVLLCSFLAEPVLLAGLLSFLLENTIPGTRLERGLLSQTSPKPIKNALEYELPAPFQKLFSFLPQSLQCLCPRPEDTGDEEQGRLEPRETTDLLPSPGDLSLSPIMTRAD